MCAVIQRYALLTVSCNSSPVPCKYEDILHEVLQWRLFSYSVVHEGGLQGVIFVIANHARWQGVVADKICDDATCTCIHHEVCRRPHSLSTACRGLTPPPPVSCGQSCTWLRTMPKKTAPVCAFNSCSMQKYAWVMTCQKLKTVHRPPCSVSQQKQALLQSADAVNTAVCCQRTTQYDVHPIDAHAQTLCLARTKPICKQKGLNIAGFIVHRLEACQ